MKTMENNKHSVVLLFAFALMLALTVCALCACSSKYSASPADPTTDPMDASSEPITEQPTEQPTEVPTEAPTPRPDPIANGDGTFDLDRLSVDLSGYPDPEPATVLDVEFSEYTMEKNEVLINVYPDFEEIYSFRFSDMPPYDEEKEREYGLGGYRISFTRMDENWYYKLRHSRTVTDENDCAYILKNTLKQSFVPFTRGEESIYPWLIIYFDSDYDSEQLCIDLDGYIYHTRTLKDVDRNSSNFDYAPSEIEYDYVSKEPIDLETNLHLMAMSYHYDWTLMKGSNPVVEGYSSTLEFEGIKWEDYIDIMIEYNGETVLVTEPAKLIELTVLLDKAAGVDVKRETLKLDDSFLVRRCTEYMNVKDCLVKFKVYKKGMTETDYLHSFYLTKDGRIVFWMIDGRTQTSIRSDGTLAMLWLKANPYNVYETTFPVDAITAFIDSCK